MDVVIVDDHKLFREGLTNLLELRDIRVIGTASDGETAIDIATSLRPDIVLLDKRMPQADGLTVLAALRKANVKVPIVILTTSADEADLKNALRLGANGYLLKTIQPDDLVRGLREVFAGKTVVCRDLESTPGAVAGSEHPGQNFNGVVEELTPRESEILGYIAGALSNKSIAHTLGISVGTVKLHVKAILRKLGVHSRVQAAVFAVEHGFRLATPGVDDGSDAAVEAERTRGTNGA